MQTIRKIIKMSQLKIILFIILFCFLSSFLICCRSERKDNDKEKPTDSLNQSNELKRKELELKEKELELKTGYLIGIAKKQLTTINSYSIYILMMNL